MVSEKLIAFILKARQNKRNDDQITQQLLSVGWKQEAISDALSEIKKSKMVAPTAAQNAQMAKAQAQAAQQPVQPALQPAQPASQPVQTAPPWVKPDSASVAQTQPAATVVQPPAQQQAIPAASSSSQTSSAPPGAVQTAQTQSAPMPSALPAQPAQAVSPPAQSPPIMPAPQTSIPPANQIQLPTKKPSFLSSLFGKKQPQQAPIAPPASQPQQQFVVAQQPNAPVQQQAAQPAMPVQSTLQQSATSQQPILQGQSTLPTFVGASAQQNAMPASAPSAMTQQSQAVSQAKIPSVAPQTPPQTKSPINLPSMQASPMGAIMKFLPIIVFAIILAAAGAYYFFVMAPAGSAPPTPTPPIPPIEQNITPSNPLPQASGPIDCGTDMDCFIQASSVCQPAEMVRSSSMDLSGMTISSSTRMQINASGDDRCSLYSKVLDASVKFSDALVASTLAKGVPIDEIRKQESATTQQAKATVGLNGTCKFSTASLSAMLSNWKSGSYSASDLSGAECSGKLYDGSTLANISLPNFTAQAANTSIKTNTTVKTNTTIKTNSTSNSTSANATKANQTSSTAKNTTAANATNPANASSTAATFNYSRQYTSYYPEHLVWFCTDRNTEFYRMHWKEYFGGDCGVPKPKEGYVNFSEYIASGCTLIPCCINGPYNEYSRLYDYFECGYN